ncbi:PX domain-containing protein kinase-like protein isoform X1 [Drosophila novamexicana]|uniref:PX domain-containing protein kinase-like protein isoform X1 n=1 Tax=Drosophila novamexicana TaxID=47314 RepID=UPI0011E5E81A|nr:PX domain-containing protein kinase-like protein isoform X1 [Drosophila novamexicana]XP_030557974.1 PX domain-containing protein kinase-like protein isoform X1 [Drosophila novamexicana]
MAIFASRYERKLPIDDTEAITCEIATVEEIDGHTEYLLRVQRGDSSWNVLRRYNDFNKLHKSLRISGIELPLPGKRIFGNMRPDFIAERKEALQVYINTILMNPILASSLPAKRFVDPESYSQSFHDHAVQHALLCLRNDTVWTLGATMGAIGWRLRKHYFKATTKPPEKSNNKLVKSGSQNQQSKHFAAGSNGGAHSVSIDAGTVDPNAEMVAEWLEYGPDKYVDDKEMNGVLKSLMGLQHPHIESIVLAANTENGCLIIRKFHKHGTLKDVLCMATPKNPFLSKYGNPKGRTALSMKQVATYGKQILETLIFLHSKGYAYGHLHSGNIVIVDDCVKLLDVENYLVGVPAFYRPFFVQHSKIHTIETVDVYCFGHVLFEMAMGYPLQESVVRQITECPEALKSLLESILSKEACKAGLPTLEQLLGHRFFTQYATDSGSTAEKPYFKLSLNAKELLRQAAVKCENRLRDEQKSVKNQKRIVRVQELMSSEEEKRKSKQKAKLEHKQSKLKQQGSLQASNGRLSLAAVTAASTSTVTAGGGLSTADSFNRSDSTPEEPHLAGIKSIMPAAQQSHQVLPASSAAVERQISTPNIATEDVDAGEDEPTRSALLESICKFNRGSLRKVRSND